MLRHSPLPPLVLSSALALGLALTGTRIEATASAVREKRTSEAPAPGNPATTPPGDGASTALDAPRAGPRAL